MASGRRHCDRLGGGEKKTKEWFSVQLKYTFIVCVKVIYDVQKGDK